MQLIELTSPDAEALSVYRTLTEAQLRNRLEPEKGIFIAESPKVIRVALEAGLEPVSLLCERKHVEGDAREIIAHCPAAMPVYRQPGAAGKSDGVYADQRRALCHASPTALERGGDV